MHKPLITVIVPIYNAREYLPKTLRSIRHSKYENLEVILVDDGSTDGSISICNTYARTDKRFKVISKENGGVSSARNAGLEAASGEWIAFCDADDTVEPYMFSYLIKKALKYSADIVQCGIYLEGENSSETAFCPGCDVVFRATSKVFGKHFLKLFSYSCFSKLYRKSILESVRFDESCKVGEDLRFGLDALDNSYKIVFASKPMYRYLQRADSVIHTTAESGNLTEFDNMIEKASDYYADHPSLGKVTRIIALLNYTDMCSKIVLGNIPDTETLFEKIRTNIRKNTLFVLFASRLSFKEKSKLLLIGYAPKLYKKLLHKYKPDETSVAATENEGTATVSETASEAAVPTELSADNSAQNEAPEKKKIAVFSKVSELFVGMLSKVQRKKTDKPEASEQEVEKEPAPRGKISEAFKKLLNKLKPPKLDDSQKVDEPTMPEEEAEKKPTLREKISEAFKKILDELKPEKIERPTSTSTEPKAEETTPKKPAVKPLKGASAKVAFKVAAPTEEASEPSSEKAEEASEPSPEKAEDSLDNEELQAIQKSSFEALLEIRRICDNHGLKYYLTAGTLLGAVRHNGFIPWDDDIDIAMPREDYNKFLEISKRELSSAFFLQNEDTEDNFPFYYSKLRVNGTEVREAIFDGVELHKGCYADIFPIDVCPSKEEKAQRFFKIILFIQSVLLSKVNPSYTCQYEKKGAQIAYSVAKALPASLLMMLREKVCAHYTKEKHSTKLCTVAGSWGYPRETYEKSWFEGEATVEFEGEVFPIPVGYHELLTNMYGDYMTEPSDENRRSHFLKVNSAN